MTKLHKILHDTQNVSLTCTVVKNFNVKIPRWRTADILKIEKLHYLMMIQYGSRQKPYQRRQKVGTKGTELRRLAA